MEQAVLSVIFWEWRPWILGPTKQVWARDCGFRLYIIQQRRIKQVIRVGHPKNLKLFI